MKEHENKIQEMPNFESETPIGVMVNTIGWKVKDAGSNLVLVHFHNSRDCLEALTVYGPEPSL